MPNYVSRVCVGDNDYRSPRGLSRTLFQKPVERHWIDAHDNIARYCGESAEVIRPRGQSNGRHDQGRVDATEGE